MDKQILPLFTFDEAITFVGIKPFDNSLGQNDNLLSHSSSGEIEPQPNPSGKTDKANASPKERRPMLSEHLMSAPVKRSRENKTQFKSTNFSPVIMLP